MQLGNCECIRSYESRNTQLSSSVDGISTTALLTDVTFAHQMMFNFISSSLVRMAGYRVINEGDKLYSTNGVTRIVHKQNREAVIICDETVEGLYEAMLSAQVSCF